MLLFITPINFLLCCFLFASCTWFWCLTLYHYSINCWVLSIFNCFTPIPFCYNHTLLSSKGQALQVAVIVAHIYARSKASKNKCLVSHLHLCLIQGLRKKLSNWLERAFSQFLKHLSRPIRSRLRLHLKLY